MKQSKLCSSMSAFSIGNLYSFMISSLEHVYDNKHDSSKNDFVIVLMQYMRNST